MKEGKSKENRAGEEEQNGEKEYDRERKSESVGGENDESNIKGHSTGKQVEKLIERK